MIFVANNLSKVVSIMLLETYPGLSYIVLINNFDIFIHICYFKDLVLGTVWSHTFLVLGTDIMITSC